MRTVSLVAAAAAIAALAALLLAHSDSAPALAPPAPLAVAAGFDRSLVDFGDPVTAHVVVTLDRGAVRPRTLRVVHDLAPFTGLAAPIETRTVSGRVETVSITQRVACFTAQCLARTIALPPVRATAAKSGGGVATASAPWRRLRLRSRVTAADLAAASPRFVADTAPGTPAYRVAPGTTAVILDVVAALAAAGAAALLVLEALRHFRGRRHAVTGDELARALGLVREAEHRPAPDRRRALALLARLLRSRDTTLGRAASDLAWARPTPEPPAVDALVARVEQERAR